jgi:hypothetical protein
VFGGTWDGNGVADTVAVVDGDVYIEDALIKGAPVGIDHKSGHLRTRRVTIRGVDPE